MEILVVGLNGCLGSAFVGLMDILWLAQRAIVNHLGGETPFRLASACLEGNSFLDGHGRRFAADANLDEISTCRAILVPGFAPDETGELPLMSAFGSAAAWIRRQHARGALVYGSCNGVFLLGEAGLLDGRRCTTTWWRHDELKRRYPRADAAWGATLIEDRRVVTAGGPLSWIDLALHAIRTLCGAEAARIAADFTVVDTAPSTQALYIPASHLAASNPFLVEAEHVVRQTGAAPLSAPDLARALATSERTLHRRLKEATGETPKSFIDRIRFQTARTLLETSAKSIKELAAGAGFADEASFRRSFRRYTGLSPGAYRLRARSRSRFGTHVFAIQKDPQVVPPTLMQILDSCINGVTLADPDIEDAPIVYANRAFQEMTGYSRGEIIGRNCRFLQGADRDQDGRQKLREAIKAQERVEVTLRNYRKNGELFHNRVNIAPLRDADGRAIYLLGVQYDVTSQVRADDEIERLESKLQALEKGAGALLRRTPRDGGRQGR